MVGCTGRLPFTWQCPSWSVLILRCRNWSNLDLRTQHACPSFDDRGQWWKTGMSMVRMSWDSMDWTIWTAESRKVEGRTCSILQRDHWGPRRTNSLHPLFHWLRVLLRDQGRGQLWSTHTALCSQGFVRKACNQYQPIRSHHRMSDSHQDHESSSYHQVAKRIKKVYLGYIRENLGPDSMPQVFQAKSRAASILGHQCCR